MKKFNKVICLILGLILTLGVVSCTSSEQTTSMTALQYAYDYNDKTKELNLVKDGVTNYKIVTPVKYSETIHFALTELQELLYKATGLHFEAITDEGITYDESKYYISVGNTTILQNSSIDHSFERLSYDGCIVKLCGNQIILAGSDSVTEYGYIYAVYDFLHYAIDYECFSETEVCYTKTNYIPLMTYDSVNIPDIPLRSNGLNIVTGTSVPKIKNAARMRLYSSHNSCTSFKGQIAATGLIHNLDFWMPQEEYNEYWNEGQLCFSNPKVAEILTEKVIERAEEKSTYSIFPISIEDNSKSCSCDNCVASDKQFGGRPMGTLLNCINQVAKAVKTHFAGTGREINVLTLAYNAYEAVPENIVAEDNVIIYIAPIYRCYKHELTGCERNASFYETILGYSKICKNISIYDYGTEFTNYYVYLNDWNRHKKDAQIYKDLGVELYRIESNAQNETSPFMDLRVYFFSRITWDTNCDPDEIIEHFMTHYYREGATCMKEFYNLLSANYSFVEKDGFNDQYIYNNIAERYFRTEVFTVRLLNDLIELADKAKEAIVAADYDTEREAELLKRVEYERFFMIHTLKVLHSSSLSATELAEINEYLDKHYVLFGNRYEDDHDKPAF